MIGPTVVDVSPSLDGYLAGAGVEVDRPFGDAAHRLHRWLGMDGGTPDPADEAAARRMFADCGAVVMGRTMYDVGIGTWGEDGSFGVPCFVATHRPHQPVHRGPTSFTFVTDGVREALVRARRAAGDREVVVVGGASVVHQCLGAGLVDELRLHVAPVILGAGTRLFADGTRRELVVTAITRSSNATHLELSVR